MSDATCAIDGCAKPREKTKGGFYKMCAMHNSRLKRHGDVNQGRYRRPVTETQAWCGLGKHMVDHAGFAKNQTICRPCRRVYNENNYSAGRVCRLCSRRVSNNARTNTCRPCWPETSRGIPRKLGKSKNHHGYIVLSGQYDHPNASARGLLLEHVKVMSEIVGRPLVSRENVHHINGVRDDNRPENLELWSTAQPPGQRVADRVEWAKELLRLYEPGALLESTIWACTA